MKSSDNRLIRLIAAFKLLKAALLIALGVGAFKLLHQDVAGVVEHWIEALKLDPGNHFVDAVLTKASNLTPDQVKKLGLGSFIYAGLFLTEGIGLWLLKRWAEWLTTIITASLIPLEAWEIFLRPTIGKGLILLANVAVVAYLVWHVRRTQASRYIAIVK